MYDHVKYELNPAFKPQARELQTWCGRTVELDLLNFIQEYYFDILDRKDVTNLMLKLNFKNTGGYSEVTLKGSEAFVEGNILCEVKGKFMLSPSVPSVLRNINNPVLYLFL